MALSALLFDLDGTLIDTNEKHARAWRRAFESHDYRVPVERILLEIGKGSDRVMPALLGEEAARKDGEAMDAAHGEAYREIVSEEAVPIFPQARALLEAAGERGLKTAVVTASSEDDLETVLERAGLDLFARADAIVTGDDAERTKPAPDAVQAGVRALGLSPGECAMIGDTPYDAVAARRAGVVLLGVLTGAHPAEALHRAGARATYDDAAALHAHLDEALRRVAPGRQLLNEVHLRELVQEALDEAWAGLSEGELPIGSVVADGGGHIAGRGRNRARATGSRTAHAEMMALADAAGDVEAGEGAILATTLEPCAMCLGAAMEAGLDAVVYAVPAPANGGAERVTPPAGGFFPRMLGGVRAEGSRVLLRRWLDRHPEDGFVEQVLKNAELKQF